MVGSRSAYTRKRILDTAARLFAQKGDNTSLREITAEARVNLSSVNYHFGSKDGLVQAVYQQRLDTLMQEQLAVLSHLEARAGSAHNIDPQHIVEAFFRPLLQQAWGSGALSPLDGQMANDTKALIRTLTLNGRSESLDRFRKALLKVLPNTPELELLWRLQFMLGAACSAASVDGLQLSAEHTEHGPLDRELLTQRLMLFLAGGLQAPVPQPTANSPSGDL